VTPPFFSASGSEAGGDDEARALDLLRAVIAGATALQAATPTTFFPVMARHLASVTGARALFLAEWRPNRVARCVGSWVDGAAGAAFEYRRVGTPCADLETGGNRVLGAVDLPRFTGLGPLLGFAPSGCLVVPLRDGAGQVIGHLTAISDQPLAFDPLLVSVVEVFAARAASELTRAQAERRERAVLETNNAIISSLTQKELLRAMSTALRQVVQFDRAALALHDAGTNTLRILALEGPLPPRNFPVGVAFTLKDSHVGWVFENRRTLLRQNLDRERHFESEERLYSEGLRSLCTAPLLLGDRCLGTITVGSLTPDQFNTHDEDFLRQVSNQVALAISNVRAFEEIDELRARLQAENAYLQEEIREQSAGPDIVGSSAGLLEVLRQVEQVAATPSTVLITGETGTGKELVARAIHERSGRRGRPLVKVNCGAISAGLVESELFGHVKGAFTGALTEREGRFKLADRGTLFLDEVSELPLEAQVKLLRVLQEQEFEPVGSGRTVRVDVRVIAATNRDLAAQVAAGRFRSDLYYRLNVVPVRVPPLRERRDDIEVLARLFIDRFARRFGKAAHRLDPSTMAALRDYDWPGNIRELQNVIERAVVLSQGEVLALSPDFNPHPAQPPAGGAPSTAAGDAPAARPTAGPLGEDLEQVSRRHIVAVLEQTGWTIEGEHGAARILNLHPNTLRSRMKKLGLQRPGRPPHRPA